MLFDPRSEEYQEGLEVIQDAVMQMHKQGVDFKKKGMQDRFRKSLISNMKRLANDKRLFDKVR